MSNQSEWTVYMLHCSDGSFYTGITTDMTRRLAQHNAGTGAKYTKSRRPCELIYQESAANRSEASKREAAIKSLTREEKYRLLLHD